MLTLCSDLFLTDAFLIKGNVENKYTRLSKLLDEHRKTFLRIRDVTLVDLRSRERIQTPLLHMNVDEVLLAHEFLDEAGDKHRAQIARDQDEYLPSVRVFYTGNLNLEIAGAIQPNSYEVSDRNSRRFFVMRNPKLGGFEDHGDQDLSGLHDLPYAILNKFRLSYIYDFN
jgi:hypothetical protein